MNLSRRNNIEEMIPQYRLENQIAQQVMYGDAFKFPLSATGFAIWCRKNYAGEDMYRDNVLLSPQEAHEFLYGGGAEDLWAQHLEVFPRQKILDQIERIEKLDAQDPNKYAWFRELEIQNRNNKPTSTI
jgi:hypothetical protein